MLKNYLLIAVRSLRKNSGFTFVNIFGLALGMAVFLLIVHFVRYEHSYESFHTNADNIHRITLDIYNGSEYVVTDCETHAGMGPLLKSEMPEVKEFVRMYAIDGKFELKDATTKMFAEKLFYADQSALNVFSINIIHGDTATMLNAPFKAVINSTIARSLFGTEDVVGRTFEMDRNVFEVTGVMKDLPPNTHLKMNALFSHSTLNKIRHNYSDDNWNGNNEFTYLLLEPGTDLTTFNKKLSNRSVALKSKIGNARYVAEPIRSIHLHSNKTYEPEPNGSAKVISFLAIMAALIIVIAWVNYINLSTARAVERAREVGIRKMMGSMRGQLILQFLSESVVINFIAAFLAAVLFETGLPYFQQLTGQPLASYFAIDTLHWYIFGTLVVVGTFFSGFYPSFVLSSFKPAAVLKGKFQSSYHGTFLRKALVVFQFGVTVVLIVAVSTVYQQINHLQSIDLGVNVDKVVAVRAPANEGVDSLYLSGLDKFKADLASTPNVIAVARTGTLPGQGYDQLSSTMFSRLGKEESGEYEYYYHGVDMDYFNTMSIKFVAGRNYDSDQANDFQLIINETAAQRLGFATPEEAIGQKVTFQTNWGQPWSTVIGVVEDFYQRSPKEKYIPMAFPFNRWADYITVKLQTEDVAAALARVKAVYSGNFPNSTFDYEFVDELYNHQYQAEQQFGKVIVTSSVFAVAIACLGLFGLSSYTILQRTKEIGIRKVLGASVPQVVKLLSGGFLRVVLFASIAALPLAYWLMSEWLANYPVRIELNAWLFVAPVILIVIIALMTVSVQTFRSAIANPVDSLKQE